jgi:hypothetical protein
MFNKMVATGIEKFVEYMMETSECDSGVVAPQKTLFNEQVKQILDDPRLSREVSLSLENAIKQVRY